MEVVRRRCEFNNEIDVGAIGTKGGLSFGWKDNNSLVTLRSFSQYHIDMNIFYTETDTSWRLTRFYGSPEENHRNLSWNLLR